MSFTPKRIALALLVASTASASPGPAEAPAATVGATVPPAARRSPDEAWRGTRWGMTVDEILKALPGEAFQVTPEVKLADGSVVAAGIDGFAFEGLTFDVRFLLTGGKLSLVSLRTPQKKYVDAEAYARLREALSKRWGPPLEETKDDALVDMRQTRWNLGADRADLKYIPGVVALIHYPRPAPQ